MEQTPLKGLEKYRTEDAIKKGSVPFPYPPLLPLSFSLNINLNLILLTSEAIALISIRWGVGWVRFFDEVKKHSPTTR